MEPLDEALGELTRDEQRTATRHALWRAGDLSYHCSEIQRRLRALVYAPPSRRIVSETSRRFGKSRTCTVVAGEHALAYPGIRIPYAAGTGVQVRNFVHPHMLKLGAHAPDELAPEIVSGDWVFPPLQWYDTAGNPVRTKLHGGVEVGRYAGKGDKLFCSRVAPHGCEDRHKADALRGTGTVLAIVDEARDIPILEYVLSSVLGPMLWEARSEWHEDVDPVMLVASTTPERLDHPFIGVADAAKAKGAYLHADVYECDHLTERDIADAIEEAGGEHTPAWRREGLALRDRDPRYVAFTEFDRGINVVAFERPEKLLPTIIGDGGYIDQAAFLFGFYDYMRAVYCIEDELVFQRTTSRAQGETIEARAKELWPGLEVERRRVDAPPQVRADMNRPEWGEATGPAGTPEECVPHWLGVSKPRGRGGVGSFKRGVNTANVLLGQGRVEIHPRCMTLVSQLDSARWNTQRTEFERVKDENDQILHHYDAAAAFMYFVRDTNTVTNPYPKAQVRRLDEFRKHRERDEELERLSKVFRRRK